MARFSNKIQDVKFVDQKEKTIEILYGIDDQTHSYILELNYNNQDFLDLLDEFTIENIQDRTKNYYSSLENRKNRTLHDAAKSMFDEWVINAQIELDKQDEERYKLFEKYKEKELKILQAELDEQVSYRVSEGFKGVDKYKEEQLSILQAEVDEQIEKRYKEADAYKQEQLNTLQSEVDLQIEERYKEADAYKQEQLDALQSEVDLQIEERYKEVELYKKEQLEVLQQELDEQVERRVSEGFRDVDEYRDSQLKILQSELDVQVEERYKQADAYKTEQLGILQSELDVEFQKRYDEVEDYKSEEIKNIKQNFMDKFKLGSSSTEEKINPENVAKYLVTNKEDEDTVFKTKLVIFNLPEVKNHKDRKLKMKVRKAKSIPELFAAYYDIQHNHG